MKSLARLLKPAPHDRVSGIIPETRRLNWDFVGGSKVKRISLSLALGLSVSCTITNLRADVVVFSDNFAVTEKKDNSWSCVDGSGQIKAIPGYQLVVDDTGNIAKAPLAPSVAVGDLNGDGLPDLVIADAYGFFWYFRNEGTKDAPQFKAGEIMPLWLGDPCSHGSPLGDSDLVTTNIIPRIQLVDLDHDGKLGLVVGNYLGKLFYLRNLGSSSSPVFKMPRHLDDIMVSTRREGRLWCNYLAPFLYDWFGTGHLDSTIGDGSYSANSIYLLKNMGSNEQPAFSEDNTVKIIPGMGREHLIPQVVSWNGDGKADVLSTEREGYLNLFLNQGVDHASGYPAFDQGRRITVGGNENLGERSTVNLAKLTPSGLPGLIIGTTDGHVSYAKNVGKADDFQFAAPVPLMATNTRPQIMLPSGWSLNGAFGSPYDLLVVTNSQVEPGFKPPPDSGVTTALRFYIDEPAKPNPTFPEHFYPEVDTRVISRAEGISMAASTDYKLSFWVRGNGNISNFKYVMGALQTKDDAVIAAPTFTDNIGLSDKWFQYTAPLRFRSASDDEHAVLRFNLQFSFNGKGSLYIAAVKVEEVN